MLLSGKSLALSCRWNCCPRYPANLIPQFSYMLAKHGDRVFINLDFVQNFTRHFILWGARKKFVLVCQNSDRQFNEERLRQLAPYALHIYSINCPLEHPTVTAIPIGFGDWSLNYIESHPRPDVPRDIEILAGFSIATNPAKRQPCADALANNPNALNGMTTNRADFYDRLWRSKYVVCPEGEGHDTHRIYESLYFGAVPVLLRGNPLTHMYNRLELPIKWVDSWEEIDTSEWDDDKRRLEDWVSNHPDWFGRTYIS